MKRAYVFGVSLVALIGCSSGPAINTTKTAFALPPGATQADSDDKTVSLGVPSGWRVGVSSSMSQADLMSGMGSSGGDSGMPPMPSGGDSGNGDAAAAVDALNKMSAQMEADAKKAEAEALAKLKEKGIIIHCINSSKPIPGEKPTQFYVLKQSQGGNWNWADAEKSEDGQFKTKPTATKVTLPIGQALRMQDTWQLVDGANFTQVSYVIPNGKDLYSIRFITEESPEVVTTIDKQVAESFRVN
ncbi:MAG: hypothetical protein JST51_03855 [Armatimonadetes bacterium]|nr:hypothetical protein [Armatimonadota bacterium]